MSASVEGIEGRSSIGARWVCRPFVVFFGFLAVVFAVLFLFSSTYHGFQLATPLGVLRCREAYKLLWDAVLFWAVWTGLCRLCGCLEGRDTAESALSPRQELSPHEERWVTAFITVLNFLLWLRFLYRTYERYLLGLSDRLTIPFWHIHLLFAAVAVGSLCLWHGLRRSHGAMAGFVGSVVFALSPMAFYVSDTMVFGYVLLVAGWLALSGAVRLPLTRAVRFALGAAALLGIVLTIGYLHRTGRGWGVGRLYTQFVTRSAPGLTGILAAVGLAGWMLFRGETCALLRAALVPAAGGLALAGSRQVVGDVGALLLLPAAAVLTGMGVDLLFNRALFARRVLSRNVLVILLAGVLFGVAKDGIDRGIRPPAYVARPGEQAAVHHPE